MWHLPDSVHNRFLPRSAPLGVVDLQSLRPGDDGDKDSENHHSLGICQLF